MEEADKIFLGPVIKRLQEWIEMLEVEETTECPTI